MKNKPKLGNSNIFAYMEGPKKWKMMNASLGCATSDGDYGQPFCTSVEEGNCIASYKDSNKDTKTMICSGSNQEYVNQLVDGNTIDWVCDANENENWAHDSWQIYYDPSISGLRCVPKAPPLPTYIICENGECVSKDNNPGNQTVYSTINDCKKKCGGCVEDGVVQQNFGICDNCKTSTPEGPNPNEASAYNEVFKDGHSGLRGAVYDYNVWRSEVNDDKKSVHTYNFPDNQADDDRHPPKQSQGEGVWPKNGARIYSSESQCDCSTKDGFARERKDPARTWLPKPLEDNLQGNACQEPICWWRPSNWWGTWDTTGKTYKGNIFYTSWRPGTGDLYSPGDRSFDPYCQIYGSISNSKGEYDGPKLGGCQAPNDSSNSYNCATAWDHLNYKIENTGRSSFAEDNIANVYFNEEPVHKDTGQRCWSGDGACGCARIMPSKNNSHNPTPFNGKKGDFNLVGCIAACPPGATCNFVTDATLGIPRDKSKNVQDNKSELAGYGGYCYACPSTTVPISEFLASNIKDSTAMANGAASKKPAGMHGVRRLTGVWNKDTGSTLNQVKANCSDAEHAWPLACYNNTFIKHGNPKGLTWVNSVEELPGFPADGSAGGGLSPP